MSTTKHTTKQFKNGGLAALGATSAAALSSETEVLSTVNAADSLAHAVKKLKNRHVLSAPVVNDKACLVGVLDMNDTLSFLVSESVGDVAGVAHHPVSAAMQFSARDLFAPCAPTDAASALLELFASGIHRVPLVNDANRLVGLVTQVDVARALVDTLAAAPAGELGHRSLASLGLGAVEPVTAWASQSVKTTIEQLDQFQVQAVGLTDDKGALVGNFSVSNLVELFTAPDRHDAALSVQAYLVKHSPASLTPLTAKPTDSLVAATKKMLDSKVHRLWIVDEHGKATGVFTFTDFCRVLLDEVDEAFQKRAVGMRGALVVGGPTVIFRTPNGHALSTDDAGTELIVRAAADEHSAFRVETQADGVHVVLRAPNGKVVAADDKQHAVLLDGASAASDSALWELVTSETGFVSLRANSGGFLELVVGGGDGRHAHQFRVAAKAARPNKKQMFKKSSQQK